MVYFAEAESSAPLQTQSPGGSCCSPSHTPVSLFHSSSKKDNISPFIPGYTHTHTITHFFVYSSQSLQLLSHVRLFTTPWIATRQASLSITNSQSLLKLMSIELAIPSNPLILCHPLLLLPPIFPSIKVFANESALCIRWPKYWSFSFKISPSNEHPGLISFRMDWLDLAVQGTLKHLLQHHSSKASSLVLSFLYIPTFTSIHDYWKNYSLD